MQVAHLAVLALPWESGQAQSNSWARKSSSYLLAVLLHSLDRSWLDH